MFVVQEALANEEWRRLKSLRSYQSRLKNKTGYHKLNTSQSSSGMIGAQNDASFLENSLRNMMTRSDLDTLLENGLDADAQEQAFASLTSLCVTLESIVATNLWQESLPESESKYPRIDRLLQELGSTEWQFYMVSGSPEPKLFATTNLQSIKERVDNFDNLFSRFTQPKLRDLEIPNAQQAEGEQTSESRGQLQKAIHTLQTLLSWLAKLTTRTCGECHNVLLQLPMWDVDFSRERFRKPHLDIYLSRCRRSEWQESCLQELTNWYGLLERRLHGSNF
jgi:hypothetical protein